jgi:chromosome segregation ATPase
VTPCAVTRPVPRRVIEVNGHRFRSETGSGEQPETVNSVAELRARAELAEQRLDDLKAALAEMRQQRDDMREQRDKWKTQAQRLALAAPKPAESPITWWRWLRSTG